MKDNRDASIPGGEQSKPDSGWVYTNACSIESLALQKTGLGPDEFAQLYDCEFVSHELGGTSFYRYRLKNRDAVLQELSDLGQEMEFQKADAGKPDLAILPYTALCAWAEGLSYGEKIKGYTRNNWRLATPADEVRLRAAALRHLHQYNEARECGEEGLDEESGISHLSLAMCNLGFLIELRERSKKK